MKVPQSIRLLYRSLYERHERLRDAVDTFSKAHMEDDWHYKSRLKEEESFALKVETGRFGDIIELEDYVACTIVVENLAAVPRAERLFRDRFDLHERRPPSEKRTKKPPESFRFDDLRLYLRWKDDPALPPTGLEGLLFEIQIKTFLQHAWGIATHDLIYKTDVMSWPKERIAFQIKAMLEHADISIEEAERLSASAFLPASSPDSERINRMIKMINELWDHISLPANRKLLAENILGLISSLNIDIDELRGILEVETRQRRGVATLDLSPYAIVVQSLFYQRPDRMKEHLLSDKQGFKVLLHKEVDIPTGLDISTSKNVVLVPEPPL